MCPNVCFGLYSEAAVCLLYAGSPLFPRLQVDSMSLSLVEIVILHVLSWSVRIGFPIHGHRRAPIAVVLIPIAARSRSYQACSTQP